MQTNLYMFISQYYLNPLITKHHTIGEGDIDEGGVWGSNMRVSLGEGLSNVFFCLYLERNS